MAESDKLHIEKLTAISRAKAFLGREFLTWLWYLAETRKGRVVLPLSGRDTEVDLWVDDRVVLESPTAQAHLHTMRGGDPSHSAEATAALSTGKTVRELKLGVRLAGLGEFISVLNRDDLAPRALRLPTPEEDEENRANPLGTRLSLTYKYLEVLDGLFALFLGERIKETWESDELSRMRAWVKERSDNRVGAVLH